MANPNLVSWHEKEGKPMAGMLEITPGSTLVVLEPDKGELRPMPWPANARSGWVRVSGLARRGLHVPCDAMQAS